MNLAGKNILVAGGSKGIGLATVNKLTEAGAAVYVLSRSISAEWGPAVTYYFYDVLEEKPLPEGFLPAQLDGLLYAAGSIDLRPFQKFSSADLLRDYRLHVTGAAYVIQQALPALKRAGTASVVLVSSVAASIGMSFHSSVSAAKGAVNGLTLALAAEFAPHKIRVNAVAPSLTDTPLAAKLLADEKRREAAALRHPLGRIGDPQDIAACVYFLLSPESSWLTGQIIGVDGGLGSLSKS